MALVLSSIGIVLFVDFFWSSLFFFASFMYLCSQVNGKENWASEMNQYVGRTAVVESLTGKDSSGCDMARLSIDGNVISRFTFRTRDLTMAGGSPGNSLDGDSRICVGSHVIIHKHRPVCVFSSSQT